MKDAMAALARALGQAPEVDHAANTAHPHGADIGDAASRVAELERELAAQRKINAVLTRRVEAGIDGLSSPAGDLAQSALLERVVAKKTREIEHQKGRLHAALNDLKMAQAELTQSQKLTAIGQLAAGVAHEINTPIQYVSDNTVFLQRAFAGMLTLAQTARDASSALRGGDDPTAVADRVDAALKGAKLAMFEKQVPRAIEQSIEGLSRVAKIVAAMKEFSHPSMGVKAPVRVRDAIETTVSVARNEWKYVADVEIHTAGEIPEVPLLRDEFNQVVLNLLVNAAHAIESVMQQTGERGKIDISLRVDDGWLEVKLADTGTGIPEDIRARVFDPFFTTKPIGKGTGQGLAIAYSVVVDKHRGTIGFDTTVGRGTCFVMRFPTQPTEASGEEGLA